MNFIELIYFIYVIDFPRGIVNMRLGEWLYNISAQLHKGNCP